MHCPRRRRKSRSLLRTHLEARAWRGMAARAAHARARRRQSFEDGRAAAAPGQTREARPARTCNSTRHKSRAPKPPESATPARGDGLGRRRLHCIALQPLHDGTRLAICAPVTGRRHQVCAVRMDAPRARVSPQPEGDGGRKALRGTHGTQGFSAGSRRPRLVQIRAHLAHLCWPIANDTLYGGAEPRASEQRAYARPP